MAPKLLCTVLAFLLLLSFIRVLLGSDQIDLMQVLSRLQDLEMNLGLGSLIFDEAIDKLTNVFRWNDSLTGIDGFFTNIRNAILWFFEYCVDFVEVCFLVFYYVVDTVISAVVGVTRLVFTLLF